MQLGPTEEIGVREQFDQTFESCIPDIKKICEYSGFAAISIGVSHLGHQRTFHHGYRDVAEQLCPDDDTLYCIASLTKAMTAAAVGVLVSKKITLDDEDKVFNWKTVVSDIYPDLQSTSSPVVAQEATVRDLLSHRTGLAGMDNIWQGICNRVLIDKYDAVGAVNSLLRDDNFRDSFIYNNILYSLAGNIIEKVSKENSWGDFLKLHVLKPLRMDRTTPKAADLEMDKNVAEPYVILLDRTPVKINQPQLSDSTLIGSAGGIRSSVRDMLRWGEAFLDAVNDSHQGESRTPLIRLGVTLDTFNIIDSDFQHEMSYGMGWFHQRLPATLGPWSENLLIAPEAVPALPCPRASDKTYHVFSHGGLVAGFTTSFYILPSPGTAVIVLSNSNALGDAADRIAQLLIQAFLSLYPRRDFVDEAKKTAELRRHWFDRVYKGPWERNRRPGTPISAPQEAFIGTYLLTTFKFTFCIAKTHKYDVEGKPLLKVIFNQNDSQVHELMHYCSNRWSFLPHSYDEFIKTGYLAWERWEDFLITFEETDGKVHGASLTTNNKPLSFKKIAE